MNTPSFEQRLQQVEPPAADPEARLRAGIAAVKEFERLHAGRTARPARTWMIPKLWLGGLATACVLVVGVSVMWLMPASERALAPATFSKAVTPASSPAIVQEQVQAEQNASTAVVADARKKETAAATNAMNAETKVRRFTAPAPAQVPPLVLDLPLPPPPPAPAAPAPTAARAARPQEPTPTALVSQLTNAQGSAAAAASRPLTRASKDELNEVTVTGSRITGTLQAPQDPALARSSDGDKFQSFTVNPVKRTADEPLSTFSADVDTASYSFVRRQLNDGMLPPADAVRSEEMINYFDYAWPAATSREQPFKPTVTVSDSPWGQGRKLVHIGIKGYELPVRQRPDVNLVLLLDVSGSMNSSDKLPLAQRSMALLLDSLKPTDTVGIAVYAGAAGEVLPPTPVSQKETILQALRSLRPGGSTAGVEGIRLAYDMAARNFRKGGVNRILLATDGDFNVGISDTKQLQRFVEQQRDRGILLSVLGFGEGNYRDDIAQSLAQNGNGVAAYIDTLNEARKVLVQEAGSQLFTIARDVKLQVEFNPATVAEYRLVGYETRALNREDFNNDKVDAGDIGAGHTVTAIYEITPVDADAKLIDERRYGNEGKVAPRGKAGEYGYLKIRYKLPDSSKSQLVEQPIALDAGVPASLRKDVQFSTAVAGFAQLLQGGRYTGTLSYDNVFSAAREALGDDPNGYRAEFLQLVRRAQEAARR